MDDPLSADSGADGERDVLEGRPITVALPVVRLAGEDHAVLDASVDFRSMTWTGVVVALKRALDLRRR